MYDRLVFYLDGVEVFAMSGQPPTWETKEYHVSGEGNHVCRWVYEKNTNLSEEPDCGWVDYIVFSPGAELSYDPSVPMVYSTEITTTTHSSQTYADMGWEAIAGATGYEVWMNTQPNTWGAVKVATVSGTRYSYGPLIPNQMYYFWIKTVIGNRTSGFSFSPMSVGSWSY